jgi:hypothetical protein
MRRRNVRLSIVGASSIDVLVPDANSVIGQWYERTPAAADGMPPHITLLRRFSLSFQRCGTFLGALYLVPEPDQVLYKLMRRLAACFPETPPYGGEFTSPVPQMTVAKNDSQDALVEIRALLETQLAARPLIVEVTEVCVSEAGLMDGARWGVRSRISLTEAPSRT